MKIKTSEVEGQALDWAVAKAMGFAFSYDPNFKPSDYWAQGGPIIEREEIEIVPKGGAWDALKHTQHIPSEGKTPLIAAMRCLVASKLGEHIDVIEYTTGESK
jgi:hypothetical protein